MPRVSTVTGIGAIALIAGLTAVGSGFAVLSTPQEQVATAEQMPADVMHAWFDMSLTLSQRMPGATPPVVSRALGYLGIIAYEAVRPGIPGAQSLSGQLNGMPTVPSPAPNVAYDWRVVANAALARANLELFPRADKREKDLVKALENTQYFQLAATMSDATAARSVVYGQQVADVILRWAATDGGLDGDLRNFPTTYQPPQGPGMWVPTPRKGYEKPRPAMQPTWGKNRPFLASTASCTAGPPLAYSEQPGSPFYEEANEVYETVKNLDGERRNIAIFWSDDPGHTSTPPGHSIAIASIALRQENASLAEAGETYAKVGVAVADAFIGCWREKYVHNVIRPITYIQRVIDKTWNAPMVTDPVETPPFPEYPSGHSVQSGAAATVLTDLFGPMRFEDTSHDDHMAMGRRTFASFASAAEEAGISRLYGGIHYQTSIRNGLSMGECIGKQVNTLQLRPH